MKKFFIFFGIFLCMYVPVHAQELTPVTLQDKVDQMIMIGFRGTTVAKNSDIEKILTDTNVGGVILFDYDTQTKQYVRNIKNKTQLQALTYTLQSAAKHKLFIAIDQEGGKVSRLKPGYGFPVWNSARIIGAMGEGFARVQYVRLAYELASSGINVNFGPVLDVTTNEKSTIFSQQRIYSKNPHVVAQIAKICIDALQGKHIIAVGKHFPGIGDLVFDTHQTLGILPTLGESATLPYKDLIERNDLHAVMMGHVVVSDIDPVYPASISEKHVSYLRNQLGFKGLIFTDDLEMKGLSTTYSLKERVTRAVNAGNTVLVLSNNMGTYDPKLFFTVRQIIIDGVQDGSIDSGKIDDAYRRIMQAKEQL